MKKPLILAGILAAAIGTQTAFAGPKGDCDGPRGDRDRPPMHQGFGPGHDGMRGPGMHGHKMMDREFTADEIKTLNEARLIMKGNPNLKVGDVKAIDNGYSVAIVTQDDSLVEELEVAKNGMPLAMYEKMLERKEAKEKKAKDAE